MEEQLIKSGAHQRFIRMLVEKDSDEKRSMIPKQASDKNSKYRTFD